MIRLADGLYAVPATGGAQPLVVYRNADGWRCKVLSVAFTLSTTDGLCYDGADLGPFKTAKLAAEAGSARVDPLT